MQKAEATRRQASRTLWIVAWLALLLLTTASCNPRGSQPVGDSSARSGEEAERPNNFLVTVRRPSGPPSIELKQPGPQGQVGQVTCSTCHSIRPANLENRKPSDLVQFHQGMPLVHGNLACYACHNPNDNDTLRLADETVVEYAEVMALCAQCHGSQAKNYARGFHGGMTGFWDLNRGGRVRNNCIDCHDPHVPEFPKMQPTFKPRDRFLKPSVHGGQLYRDETDDQEIDLE